MECQCAIIYCVVRSCVKNVMFMCGVHVTYVTCPHSLEESGVVTDCSLQTQDAEETLDFDFISANVVNKVIMRAEGLREAFNELDMSSDILELMLSPDPPYFRLSTVGYAGSTQVH